MALVLGSAYRRLGQFKTERYQPAEAEHNKAIYYLEQDTSFLEHADAETEENFVIMLLFLLNKAKYFRDIAEKDSLRTDASYWRAVMLFREIKRKIEDRQINRQGMPAEGILARIYASARLNIAQVSRFQQEYNLTTEECVELVGFCINSLESEEKRHRIQEFVYKLPAMQDRKQKDRFSVKKFGQNQKNADYLFEDYILQALLQLGISYRDRVDFNGSREGNFWVRQAIAAFLVLGIVDRFKDDGPHGDPEKTAVLLDKLQELNPSTLMVPQNLVVQIRNVCVSGTELKNEDARNNLAVCLKKLAYCKDAIAILKDATLKGNKFAEYNLYKSYLEAGLTEETENMNKTTCTDYVNPEEPAKSNYKWLFLYGRYLLNQKKYKEAEKMFSHISSSRAMRWDSLELKAAYLEAQCQIKRQKYLSAIASLKNIHEALLKLDNERSRRRHEIRTEIDLGWCLIVEDRYKEALKVYSNLLYYLVQQEPEQLPQKSLGDEEACRKDPIESALERLRESIASRQEPDRRAGQPYPMKWHTVDSLSQEKILHNLYDCWTYLHMDDQEGTNDNIPNLIREICESINSSDIYIRYLQSLRRMNQIKKGSVRENVHDEWKALSNTFGEILKERSFDTITYSCWVIGKVNYCMGISRQDAEFETQKKQLLLGLVSSTTPITMKSYIEVAQIIRNQNGGDRFLDINRENREKEGMELERVFLELFCHVKLLENGTNMAFMKLMTHQDFRSVELITRAELLACIVELYGDILQMKSQLRVTYADLEEYAYRDQEESAGEITYGAGERSADEGPGPIICQYTRLSTLRGILPKTAAEINGDTAEDEPKFRMSNAARMNDAGEGLMFRKICENVSAPGSTTIHTEAYREIIPKYMDSSFGYKNADEIFSYDSDVYIASFSMNRDNFGLWSNYADKEKGCIIGFDQSFFDLVDKNYYSILDDEIEENALYRILYVNEQELLAGKETLGIKCFKGKDGDSAEKDNAQKDIDIIRKCIPSILEKLSEIEEKLGCRESITREAAEVIRTFIVDRLNEIRFLFKSVSYEYEEEMRMLRCSQNPEVDTIGSGVIPRLYINVEKRLDNLTLILGSRVDLEQVKELSVWTKSTGRVKQVIWSGLNRL